ncbi:MAG: hypothetical protein OSJ72_02870 [Lachnospiraceae bacterium]|nr:hypothetical protein [Lachnospiraceae bacterium]
MPFSCERSFSVCDSVLDDLPDLCAPGIGFRDIGTEIAKDILGFFIDSMIPYTDRLRYRYRQMDLTQETMGTRAYLWNTAACFEV